MLLKPHKIFPSYGGDDAPRKARRPASPVVAAPRRFRPSWRTATWLSSTTLRICSFIFLRWIPGHHLVPAILVAHLLYSLSFHFTRPPRPSSSSTEPARPPTSPVDFAPPQPGSIDAIGRRYATVYERIQAERQRRDEQMFLNGRATESRSSSDEGALGQRKTVQQMVEEALGDETPKVPPAASPKRQSQSLATSTPSLKQKSMTSSTASLQRKSQSSLRSTASSRQPIPLANDTSPAGITETLLTGLPNAASTAWSAATWAINAVLVLMVLDVVLRAPLLHKSEDLSFARVGFVGEKTARILVREPDAGHWPVKIEYRMAPSPTWTPAGVNTESLTTAKASRWTAVASVPSLDNTTDYTHAFTISGLKPATTYEYTVFSGQSGTFSTAPKIGSPRLTFLSSSCLKPRVPYTPWQHPLSMPGLDTLATLLPRLRASFMLFLGDFIYIDVPWRLGNDAGTYRREYRQVYASPSWHAIGSQLPWLHVIDDHEIANDWDQGTAPPYPAAVDPFHLYHHSVNPPAVAKNETYYTFRHGPASFFLMDTRRHRSPSTTLPADDPTKTVLGRPQLRALKAWLAQAEPNGVRWKIVVSSVPFTRNWRANAMDTWGGYLVERQTILESMWDASASGLGVVVLSGDRHEFAATRFPAPIDTPGVSGDGLHPARTKPPTLPWYCRLSNHLGSSTWYSRLGTRLYSSTWYARLSTRLPSSTWYDSLRANLPFPLRRSPETALPAAAKKTEPKDTPRNHWGSSPASRWRNPTTGKGVSVWEFSCSPLSMFYLPVKTYREAPGEESVGAGGHDEMIAYIPTGNSKLGVIDIGPGRDPRAGDVLRYRLFVDGVEKWGYGVQVDGTEGEEIGVELVDA